MRRREFITAVGGAAAAWPLAARAVEPEQVRHIGFVEAGSQRANHVFLDSFRDGLQALGWTEGQNITITDRWAEAQNDRLPDIIAELIRSRVDVLVTAAAPASLVAKRATSTIPVVTVGVPDPVGLGLVESLAHPGGNVTGLSSLSVDLTAKRMQLLKEAIPAASRVAVIWNPKDQGAQLAAPDAKAAAEKLGLRFQSVEVATPADIEGAFSRFRTEQPDALFVINDPLTVANREVIVSLASVLRLPVCAGFRAFVVSGALISLGTSLPNDFKRAAAFVDKILKGRSPSDLPVEQPTRFEMVINLKTAKALGVAVPPTLLATADEVIE
jgi:putative tryptophan/tyrosine transport system substrate-binding protein